MPMRNVAIVLGITCFVLSVGLIGTIVEYTSIVNRKDNTIASLVSEVAGLQNQVGNLTDIVNLNASEVWVDHQTVNQPANSYSSWIFSARYAGYVCVEIHSSTTESTFVEVIYTSHGANFNQRVVVGATGAAFFPILPYPFIQVHVGNTDMLNGATQTVTITYYY